MCVIAVTNKGKRVTKKQLQNMCESNPDGFGLAYISNNTVKVYKTLNEEKFIKKAMAIQSKYYKQSNILIHCRIATHGPVNMDNCHPFRASRSLVFAHNGILDCVVDDNKVSDTRMFKNTWLRYLSNEWLDDPRQFLQMEEMIGASNKMAFLTTSDAVNKNVYILNQDEGEIHNGVWYSNSSYKERKFILNRSYVPSYIGNVANYYDDRDNPDADIIYVRPEWAIEELALHNHTSKDSIRNCDEIDYNEMYWEYYGCEPPTINQATDEMMSFDL
tara:strand:+ start:1596 stop:2417 length:822 start_codon:yes stop_codon:yes gene_type:complete